MERIVVGLGEFGTSATDVAEETFYIVLSYQPRKSMWSGERSRYLADS